MVSIQCSSLLFWIFGDLIYSELFRGAPAAFILSDTQPKKSHSVQLVLSFAFIQMHSWSLVLYNSHTTPFIFRHFLSWEAGRPELHIEKRQKSATYSGINLHSTHQPNALKLWVPKILARSQFSLSQPCVNRTVLYAPNNNDRRISLSERSQRGMMGDIRGSRWVCLRLGNPQLFPPIQITTSCYCDALT